MKIFYELEQMMKQEYREAQKSIDFLNETMKSPKYRENTKIFKNKNMERGIHKVPPYNLSLNEIATTLDAETIQYRDKDDIKMFAHIVTRSGNQYNNRLAYPPSVTPTQHVPRGQALSALGGNSNNN